MKIRRALGLILAASLVIAACGTDENAGPGDDGASFDGAWVLSAASIDGEDVVLLDQYRVTMTIDGSDIGGRAACNSYGGSVSIDDGTFSVGALSRTEMACERPVMKIEALFLQGLTRVTEATRSGDVAVLAGEGVNLTLELLPPVPTADLIDVRWTLDTMFQGETAISTVAGADPATLFLDSDGTFTGSTGCRDLAGGYVVTGDIVQFTSFGAEGECAAELQQQDSHVISVLESGFTVEIEGNRMTITAPGDEGLSYTTG